MTYRPLPEGLTIQNSEIDNLGLFATEEQKEGVNVGVTHIIDSQTHEVIRTPLGGFINHSEEPNSRLIHVGPKSYLIFNRDIKAGEEVTLKYTMYDPTRRIMNEKV
tara:strand:- start:784 stop:1101 length:318 start_codon:yes stop_codon:yes gene_type:complete